MEWHSIHIIYHKNLSFSIKLIHVSELGNGQTHASDYLGFKDETLQAVPKSSKWSNDFPGDNVMKLNANPEAKKKYERIICYLTSLRFSLSLTL